MFYSSSTGGFYNNHIHGVNIPRDAVEITDAEHQALIAGQSQGMQIQTDENGRPILVAPPTVPAAERRLQARDSIDRAAGAARSRFIADGTLIDAEYVQAETAARAYADADYSGPVPPSVQAWVDAAGLTPQHAADDILATAQRWRDLLDQIRAIRLGGKAAVDAAADADIESVAQGYIDQLDAIKPA